MDVDLADLQSSRGISSSGGIERPQDQTRLRFTGMARNIVIGNILVNTLEMYFSSSYGCVKVSIDIIGRN